MIERHDKDCPRDLVEHLAEIEAGWTLRKWWKVVDEKEAIEENRREIRVMLERWRAHGVVVSESPHGKGRS